MKTDNVGKYAILRTRLIRLLPKLRQYIVFAVFTLSIYALTQINLFNIAEVNVIPGNGRAFMGIDTEETNIIKEAFIGVNYLSVKSSNIKKVANNNSYIESYWIEKILPNKINIYINERAPKYLVSSQEGTQCALLDSKAYTLEVAVKSEVCQKYSNEDLITPIRVSPFPTFVPNTQSSFLYLTSIDSIEKVLEHYGYKFEEINVVDGVCTVSIQNNRTITISFNQELKVQLARLVVIAEDIRSKNLDFTSLDLRYERPVITSD